MGTVNQPHKPASLQIPPPPRTVRYKPDRAGAGVYIGIFVVPLGLFGLWFLLKVPLNLYVIHRGTPVTAVIDSTEVVDSPKSGKHYMGNVHYDLNGKRYTDKVMLGYARYSETSPGDTVQGRAGVVAGRASFVLAGQETQDTAGMAFGSGMIELLAVALFMGYWMGPRRKRKLIERGSVATGHIVDRRTAGKTCLLTYEFTPPAGHESLRRKQAVPRAEFEKTALQTPVTVFYDESRPQRSVAYEFSDFEFADAKS